jgi:UDP-N-acetylmuramate--alanine ligase
LPRIEKRYLTYGLSPQADYCASNLETVNGQVSFDVVAHGEALGRVTLNMIGRHNVQNALAAIAVADEVGVDFAVSIRALGTFEGIGRRFESKGEVNGIEVVDDYAHHPEELKATLGAAREAFGRRVVVAFQPHRYSRTLNLMDEFATCFNASDVLLLTDIYAASEDPIEGVTASALADAIRAHGHHDVSWVGSVEDAGKALMERVEPGDLVITCGAGNIYQAGEMLLEELKKNVFEKEDE